MPEVFPVTTPFAYSLVRTPSFRTLVIGYGNKVEQRLATQEDPRYTIKAKFASYIIAETSDLVFAFFTARKGCYEAFYLQNPEEAYRNIKWQAEHSYALNAIVRPVTANGRSYICTAAGSSGAAEPAWPTTANGTVADGGATWRENSYLVRFKEDLANFEYFAHQFYRLGEIEFIEVDA